MTVLTDGNGKVVKRYRYRAFGEIYSEPGSVVQPYTFTARENDPETGLYYYRARYYDPRAGRFITKDPIGFAGGDANLYRYVGNNPIKYRDPFGLWGEDVHFGIGNPNYGTYAWATHLGLSDQQATWLALGNNGADGGFAGWVPIIGLQSRHFYHGFHLLYENSRDYWADIELQRAVNYYKDGNCKAAFGHLGKGLHSIQDKISHGAWDTGPLGLLGHPEWLDSWNDPRNSAKRELTETRTKEHIIRFLSLIGQK